MIAKRQFLSSLLNKVSKPEGVCKEDQKKQEIEDTEIEDAGDRETQQIGGVTGQGLHIPQGCALRSTYLLTSQLGPDSSESGIGLGLQQP